MPIQPDISRRLQQHEPVASPLETIGRVLQLKDLLAQGPIRAEQLKAARTENEMRGLQVAENKKKQQDRELINRLMLKNLEPGEAPDPAQAITSWRDVGTASPGAPTSPVTARVNQAGFLRDLILEGRGDLAAEHSRAFLDQWTKEVTTQKAELDNRLNMAQAGSQALALVKDQATYDIALRMMKAAGLPINELSPHYNEAEVEQYVTSGLTAQERLNAQKQEFEKDQANLSQYGRGVALAASRLSTARSVVEADILADNLRKVPGMAAEAVDAAVDAFKRGGREAVETLARTPDQSAKSKEEAARGEVRERRAAVGEAREGRQRSAAVAREQRAAGHFRTLELLRAKVRAGVGRGESAKAIVEHYLKAHGEALAAGGVNVTAVRSHLLKEFGGAR